MSITRRKFLKVSSLALGASAGIAGAAFIMVEPAPLNKLSINYALNTIDALAKVNLASTGRWNPATIFAHCAQSIEYSMSGYPLHQSSLFKSTIGKAAFSAFQSKGKMTHGLADAIPGAPAINQQTDITTALNLLKASFIRFQNFKEPLQPHFAYGRLTHKEYILAHVMHFNNHLSEIVIVN